MTMNMQEPEFPCGTQSTAIERIDEELGDNLQGIHEYISNSKELLTVGALRECEANILSQKIKDLCTLLGEDQD